MDKINFGNVVEYRVGDSTEIGVVYGSFSGFPRSYFGYTLTGGEWISDDVTFKAHSLYEYLRTEDNGVTENA